MISNKSVMRNEPVKIHLDTWAYSRLYRRDKDKEANDLWQFLKVQIAEEKIAVGFSIWNLFEFLQCSDEEHANDRKLRANCISELCEANAFPFFSDYASGARFPNSGNSFPSSWVARTDFYALLLSQIKSSQSYTWLNRKQRRRFLSDLTLSIDFYFEVLSPFGLSRKYIEHKFSNTCGRLNKKKASQLNTQLHSFLTSPEVFFNVIQGNESSSLTFWFENLKELVKPIEEIIQSVQLQKKRVDKANREIRQLNRRLDSLDDQLDCDIFASWKQDELLPLGSSEIFENAFAGSQEKIETKLGKDFLEVLIFYISYLERHHSKFRKSEIIDLFQVALYPQADVIVVDKKMRGIFRNFHPVSDKACLVSNFGSIGPFIESKLA